MSLIGRASVALLSTALAVSLAATGQPAQATTAASPAGHAATWESHQLTHGLIHNPTFGGFDDYGLSLDTGFALLSIGREKGSTSRIRTAMTHHVGDYTTDAAFGLGDVFAGAIAKLLVYAQATGGGARSFGGTDLVAALEDRVATTGPARGRIQDVVDPSSTFGDSANTLGQIFAVRGLLAAHSDLAAPSLRYLLLQQCDKGYFRLDLGKATASKQSCTKKDPVDNDVTALVVTQLWKYRTGHSALRHSLRDALGWLASQENKSGGVAEGSSGSTPNSNSSGLAAWALGIGGRCASAAKAASFVSKLQLGGGLKGTPLAGERGAIAFNRADLRKGQRNGITATKQDAWRRATAQAAPGLLFLGGAHCK
jgi:hypothetical protein